MLWGGVDSRITSDHREIYPIFFVKHKKRRHSNKDTSTEILYIVGIQVKNDLFCGCCKIPDTKMQMIYNRVLDFEGKIFLPDKMTCIGRTGKHWGTVDNIDCDLTLIEDCFGIQVR